MMIKFGIYILAITSLYILPEQFWEKLSLFVQILFDKSDKVRHGFRKLQRSIPLINELKSGDELLLLFPKIEALTGMGQKTVNMDLPQFKFYTGLILRLLESHRQLGVSLKKSLPELRTNLIKDLQFEKKILSVAAGSNLQFVVVTVTTWSFILLSLQLAEIPASGGMLSLILLIQVMAFIFFNLAFAAVKNRGLGLYSRALQELYTMKGMVDLGLPVNLVLTESNCLQGAIVQAKQFNLLGERLFLLVNRWKNSGLSPREEIQEIIHEVWHEKEQGYIRFLKQLDLLKFVVLAFFFLPAYFIHLWSIFQFFMEQ